MKILIDPGHGRNTPGKCSPDGRFREYQYTREIAAAVVARLQALGHDAEVLVPEFEDIPLSERCRRVNAICQALGPRNVILISIHVNAAGRGDRWYDATGWCAYTTRGDTRADALATSLYEAAKFHLPDQRLRTGYTDGDPDLEADFYILRHSLPPAVLVENFFMDSRRDYEFLLSADGQQAIVNLHVDGICRYLSTAA
jgi:N-acetylmuramoyl-L-alanine amidase